VSILKQQYNDLLVKINKAIVYMDSAIPKTEKERWQPKFKALIDEANDLIKQIGDVTEIEILEGFKE
jgi:hypothetical protein